MEAAENFGFRLDLFSVVFFGGQFDVFEHVVSNTGGRRFLTYVSPSSQAAYQNARGHSKRCKNRGEIVKQTFVVIRDEVKIQHQ